MNRLHTLCATVVVAATMSVSTQAASRLFVIASQNLNELNPATGAVIGTTAIVPTAGSIGTIGALAYDAASDTLFLSSTGNDNLWTVNYTTGVATLVGLYNVGATVIMHGLAVDDTGQLYGYSSGVASGARFFSINRTTGQATPIADMLNAGFGSLEFVASTQTMYLADTGATDSLYTIDRTTGAVTLVGSFGVVGSVGIGLAYDSVLGMYACSNTTPQGLYTIDLATGAATLVGALSSNPIALTFIGDPNTPSTPFCLGDGNGAACPCANTGAAGHGCASMAFAGGAILSSTGIAGASAGSDTLVLTATDIPGPALFFQSSGVFQTTVNFGDGHLCAGVGITRLGVVFPVADVASYPGGLTPNPIHIGGTTASGDTRHYQAWYRSVPGLCNALNYNLTQGLTIVWGP